VLVALRVGSGTEAVLATWTLGLLVDLTSLACPIGLHAIAYAVAGGMVFQSRGAVFSENPLTQSGMTFLYCLAAHALARLFVNVYVGPEAGGLWRDLAQVLLVAGCTAIVAPIGLALLRRLDWLIMIQPAWRRR
jgi:rod shape-determining protein MreD